MPQIPFTKPFWSSDDQSNDKLSTGLWDGMLEVVGDKLVLRRRPGLSLLYNVGSGTTGVQGLHFCTKANKLLIAVNGKLFVGSSSAQPIEVYSSIASTTGNVVFAEGQTLASDPIIYIADGGVLKYYLPSTNTVYTPTGVYAPQSTSFVVWFANRFVANESNSNWQWLSDVTDPTSWTDPRNPFTAEAKADNVDYVGTVNRELYSWGKEGLEVWQEDGESPIVSVPQAFVEVGLIAPYSVVTMNETIFGLVNYHGQRSVVMSVSRQPQIISQTIARQLGEYGDISDARAFHVQNNGAEFYVLTFPTQGETWAYDIKGDYWAKWGVWNPDASEYGDYLGVCSAYDSNMSNYYVGSAVDGKIYIFSRSAYLDDTSTMRTEYQSGWIDHDTYFRRKRCKQLFIKSRNTELQTNTIVLRIRDDGRDVWSNDIALEADRQGQGDFLHKLNRFGMYRARQYSLVYTDPYNLTISEFQEDYDMLRN